MGEESRRACRVAWKHGRGAVYVTGRYRTQASGSGARFSRCEVSIRDDKCVSLTFRPLDAAVPGEDRGERDRCSMSENTPPLVSVWPGVGERRTLLDTTVDEIR